MRGINETPKDRLSLAALIGGILLGLAALTAGTAVLVHDQPPTRAALTAASVGGAGRPVGGSPWSRSGWEAAVPDHLGPTSSTSTSSTSTTEPPPVGPTRITLAFGGDVLPHMPLNDRAAAYGAQSGAAFDYAPMFAPLAPVIGQADVAICHMEVPLAPPGEQVTSYPSFGAPAEQIGRAHV